MYLDESTYRQMALTIGELVAIIRTQQLQVGTPRLTYAQDHVVTKAIELKRTAITQLQNAGAEPR